eukprot:TRINITY_DN678_c0_g1_i4.p1 TRINITY_DN678_c0_g1~~TRINITY_DN678_c0_g1_i4.p1  ORF type:complete len:342 (-),score=39.00 TRINITY_DN678_c0_g1_i4:1095-2120(-)
MSSVHPLPVDQVFDISPPLAIISCVFLTLIFVGSFYLRFLQNTSKGLVHRDDKSEVRRRMLAVLSVSLFAFFYMHYWSSSSLSTTTTTTTTTTTASPEDTSWPFPIYWRHIGLHTTQLANQILLPLLLTMCLFLGPLVQLYCGVTELDLYPVTSILFYRNYVVGPLVEEWVFRCCMLPLLVASGLSITTSILICPLFFGLAHTHHIVQHLHKDGRALKEAVVVTVVQLVYTTIFGWFSSYLFIMTGSLIAPFLSHAFCNVMGLPSFGLMPTAAPPSRYRTLSASSSSSLSSPHSLIRPSFHRSITTDVYKYTITRFPILPHTNIQIPPHTGTVRSRTGQGS